MREALESMEGRPPGERFLFWLGQAARQLREEADVSPAAVTTPAGVKREATIEAFEKGQNMPRDLERMLLAYAKLCGLDDPRDIVRDALRLWYEHGEPPENGDGTA